MNEAEEYTAYTNPPNKPLYTIGEVALALGYSRYGIYRQIRKGNIATFKPNRETFVTHRELERLMVLRASGKYHIFPRRGRGRGPARKNNLPA